MKITYHGHSAFRIETGTIVDDSKRNALNAMHGYLAGVASPSKFHIPLVDLSLSELVSFLTEEELATLLASVGKVTDHVMITE